MVLLNIKNLTKKDNKKYHNLMKLTMTKEEVKVIHKLRIIMNQTSKLKLKLLTTKAELGGKHIQTPWEPLTGPCRALDQPRKTPPRLSLYLSLSHFRPPFLLLSGSNKSE